MQRKKVSGNLYLVLLTEDGATLLQYAGNILVQYAIKQPIACCFKGLFAHDIPSILIINTTFVTVNYTVNHFTSFYVTIVFYIVNYSISMTVN